MHVVAGRSKTSRAIGAVALAVGLAGFTGAAAFAAQPVKGGSYSGSWTTKAGVRFGLSFKVSKSGKTVSAVTLPNGEPIFCQGGGFGAPVAQTKPAKISKRGAFSVTLKLYFAPRKQTQGSVVVTGSFLSKRRARGTVTTKFTVAKTCNGTVKYTAAAR